VRRLFGVSRIGIETATVDRAAPDILLGCLSNKDAIRLENLLVATLVFDGATDPRHQFDTLDIDRLSWLDLLLAGATTLQITRAGVMLYAAIQVFERFTEKSLVDEYGRFTQQHTGRYDWVAEPVGIIVALWLASTFYFVVSFSRFQLGKHEGWLLQETGVIRLSRRLIRADAIQGLEVFRSPLQRRFRGKRAMLRMRMPAYGSPSIYAMVLHPAVTDAALPRLTQEIASMDPATCAALCGKRLHRLSTGSRGVYILQWPIRIVACCAGSLALLLIVQPDLWWLALAPLPLAAPLAWAGLLAWRSAGWYADNGDWLVIQRGAFGLSSTATRVDRIQFIRWSQPLLSRRVSTISMAISVATSGGASMVSRILALLRRPANPAIVRIRAMGADDARGVAIASGYERSLPPELAAE
jgi:uncharacterized membrane protein YdbT with pleckstrin-like domain